MKLFVFLSLACVAMTSCSALFMNKQEKTVAVVERDLEAILRMLKHVLCSADIEKLFGDKQVMAVLKEVEKREKRQMDFKAILKMFHGMICSME